MKKLLMFFLFFFPAIALAQVPPVIRNDNAATTIQSNNLGNSKLATTNKGALFVQKIIDPVDVIVPVGFATAANQVLQLTNDTTIIALLNGFDTLLNSMGLSIANIEVYTSVLSGIVGTNTDTLPLGAATFPKASTTGGYDGFSFGALVGTVQTVKGSSGVLAGWQILNSAATICYLQIFDTAGAVTLGVTVPKYSLGWPAGAGANIPPTPPGLQFSSGIKVAATTGRSNSTPCGTGLDVNIWYK